MGSCGLLLQVALYDMTKSGFRHFSRKDGLRVSYTYSVLPDTNSITWAATQGGLYKLQRDSVSQIPLPGGSSMTHTLEKVGDRIWVGTESGLMYIDQDSVYFAAVLQGKPVLSIEEDPSGHLWIGTMGSGVYAFDPVTQALSDSISTKDGLNSSAVYFLSVDANNSLWVGTSKGINQVNLNHDPHSKTKDIKQFGQKDGIVGVETNKNAAAFDHEGRLWFGTLKGLMQYNAAHKPMNLVAPPVYLTDIQLFLEDLPRDDSTDQGALAFTHEENHLTFNYQGLSYISPEHLKYQYQLKGFDKGWSPLTQVRHATYSNLAPWSIYLRGPSQQ